MFYLERVYMEISGLNIPSQKCFVLISNTS